MCVLSCHHDNFYMFYVPNVILEYHYPLLCLLCFLSLFKIKNFLKNF